MIQNNPNPQLQAQQGIAALPAQGIAPPQSPTPAQPQPQQMQQTPEQILALLKQANDAKSAELAQREMALSRPAQPTVMAQLQQKAQQGQAAIQQMQAPAAPGIANLQSNIQMAGGGIVGFAGGGVADIPGSEGLESGPTPGDGNSVSSTEFSRNIANLLAAMPGLTVTRAASLARMGMPAIAAFLNTDRSITGDKKDPVSVPMQQASYSHEGRNSMPPAETSRAAPPEAVKAAAGKIASTGAPKGVAALIQSKTRTAGTPEAVDDEWGAYTKSRIKSMDVDPTKQRDADAQYVKDNSGLADEKLRRDKAREQLTAGQEATKAARPTGLRELLLNMAEQGKTNRGFRTESPFATMMGDVAGAGVAMDKTKQTNAKADYDMLVAMNKQGDADAAVQLNGNREATDAGLKGADRARAQQTAGMQAATSYAGVLENAQQRREAVAARSQDLQLRYAEMRNAKSSGDKAAATMAKEQLVQGMKALTADLQGMMRMDPVMNPGLAEDIKAARATLQGYSQALLGTVPALKDAGPQSTSMPGIDLSKWGQPKAK